VSWATIAATEASNFRGLPRLSFDTRSPIGVSFATQCAICAAIRGSPSWVTAFATAHARHARDGAPGDGLAVDMHGAIIGGVACTVAFGLMVRPKRGAEALASSQLEPAA
jgi:hypothetical protein